MPLLQSIKMTDMLCCRLTSPSGLNAKQGIILIHILRQRCKQKDYPCKPVNPEDRVLVNLSLKGAYYTKCNFQCVQTKNIYKKILSVFLSLHFGIGQDFKKANYTFPNYDLIQGDSPPLEGKALIQMIILKKFLYSRTMMSKKVCM